MKSLKVGIVGSRSRNSPKDKQLIKNVLVRQINKGLSLSLISGGCPKGADKFAEELAKELDLEIKIYNVDLSDLKEPISRSDFAKRAYARNELIAINSDILIAVWDQKSKGTLNTITTARKNNKPVILL